MTPAASLVRLVAAAAVFAPAVTASASVERFALIVGNNTGDRSEAALRYAETDAEKLHEVLADVGGTRPENMVLLRGRDADAMRRALITLNERIRTRMTEHSVEPMLVVYYSGHADQGSLHLGESKLEIDELEALVRGSAAKFRLLIVDACRSGSLTRVKGGSRVPPFPIEVQERLEEEGLVYLTSTSANEDAQESDELGGSFFTHYLVSGLLGAADENSDAAVTVEEAYAHAYTNTIRASSRTLAGVQHPTFNYGVKGRGGIVLTRLDRSSPRTARLTSRLERTYLIMHGSSEGPVMAELAPAAGARHLYVRPGRYFVRSRAPDHLLEGEVEVEAGAVVDLDRLELDRIEYARLVRKGGAELRAVHGVTAGYQVRTAIRANDDSPCHGVFAAYSLDLASLSLLPRLGACRASFQAGPLSTQTDAFELGLQLRHAWDLDYFTVETGLGGGAVLLRQSFRRSDSASAPPVNLTLGGQLSAGWAISTDLPAGVYLTAEASAVLYFFREERESGEVLATPLAGLIGLGLGKRW